MDDLLFHDNSLPPKLAEQVHSELHPVEKLLWVGQPKAQWFNQITLWIFMIGVVLIMVPFVIFGVLLWSGVDLVACFLLLLTFSFLSLLGLLLASLPYADYRKTKRTIYALTDHRAILFHANYFGEMEIRSYAASDLRRMERFDYPDQTGDLVFEELGLIRFTSDQTSMTPNRYGFLRIENGPEVEKIIRKAFNLQNESNQDKWPIRDDMLPELETQNHNLPTSVEARVRAELEEGEQYLWSTQPQSNLIPKECLLTFLVGIPWTVFVIFWISGVLILGNDLSVTLLFLFFGLPFLLVGIWLLSSPYRHHQKMRRILYVLTDHRAILFEPRFRSQVEVTSFPYETLTRTFRIEYPSGKGDLILNETAEEGQDSEGGTSIYVKRFGFKGIANVREVERLLRRLFQR